MAAASAGQPGERYILAQERGTSIRETIALLNQLFTAHRLRTPPRPPRWLMRGVAGLMETAGKLRGMAPQLQTAFVDMFWGLRLDYDTRKARQALGFRPRPVAQALREAIDYLRQHPVLLEQAA